MLKRPMNLRIGNPLWHALAALGLGALAWTSAARAAVPCSVRIVPPGAPDWEAAARDAKRRTSSTGPVPNDCQSFEVTVRTDGTARLEFTATDGRRAIREIQNPDELGPAIEALLVTVAPTPTTTALAETNSTKTANSEMLTRQAAQSTPPTPRVRPLLLFGMGAGARFTFGHKYLAPSGSFRGVGVFDQWELGIFGEWDPVYERLAGSTPPGFAMSALAVGALFGRREHTGRLDVNYGLGLGVASVASSADPDPTIVKTRSVDASQQRAAVYAGAHYPRDKSIRVTLDMLTDAALSGLRGPATSEVRLPPFPRYGVSLSLGVEAVVL
jgi:hypothetical protein